MLVRKNNRIWNRQKIKDACKLYLITDDKWLDGRSLHSCVAEAIAGGVTCVQLREKGLNTIDRSRVARNILPVCHVANVPLIINDDIEACRIANADGVHLGKNDISCREAREELGGDAIIGVTVRTLDDAIGAEEQGASYIGVDGIFKDMGTEYDCTPIEMLKEIARSVHIPVVAIGGVTASNVRDLEGSGVSGIAVMSSVLAAHDIEKATVEIAGEVDKYLFGGSQE